MCEPLPPSSGGAAAASVHVADSADFKPGQVLKCPSGGGEDEEDFDTDALSDLDLSTFE